VLDSVLIQLPDGRTVKSEEGTSYLLSRLSHASLVSQMQHLLSVLLAQKLFASSWDFPIQFFFTTANAIWFGEMETWV
jgi:hypothetical protein